MKVCVGMVDEENTVLHKQRFRNELPLILSALDPLKKDIQGVVVESTFNWYWLVDGLMDQGHRVHLANVSAIKQYEGLKQIDGSARISRQNPLSPTPRFGGAGEPKLYWVVNDWTVDETVTPLAVDETW